MISNIRNKLNEITDEPTTVDEARNIRKWYNKNDELHRDGGPAVIVKNFSAWYQNGLRHRLDGPASCLEADNNRTRFAGKNRWFVLGYDVTDDVIEAHKAGHEINPDFLEGLALQLKLTT